MTDLRFAWLEITGKCQLSCTHCYAESGPRGGTGAMTARDWFRVISHVAELGAHRVQFIGGEPTLHPDLARFVDHSLAAGLEVEVFSNLVHIAPALWETFTRPGVRLATSYYSAHDAVTRRPGSHARTTANITKALDRAIPLRVGVIDVGSGSSDALVELDALGVRDVGVDTVRAVGRGTALSSPGPDQLCGRCGHGAVAVSTSGDVWPCVFARWMALGNILDMDLADVLLNAAPVAPVTAGPSCWPQGGGSCAPNEPPRP
ncbi:hypothetical protein BBK82_01555 [Lentzea guizhouensis]|uniref:Uncharacterized protein n=1 Tax=Lentzea guizhouensis TaxID=1586287 RepID=A0A1B2HB67_9PSEU|nr:radical SAM/SPASM domain-containing protein [Lentzea guizhouensis]ANZ34952.1 hypothetical protein BBK82_01555 [Lentzea guizhouensis]